MSNEEYQFTPNEKSDMADHCRDDFYRAKFTKKLRELYGVIDSAADAIESLQESIKRNETIIANVKVEIDSLISK